MRVSEQDQFDPLRQKIAARAALVDCGLSNGDQVRAVVRRLTPPAVRESDGYVRGFNEARDSSLQLVLVAQSLAWAARSIRNLTPKRLEAGA